jgi:hypothetical protein
MGPFLRRLRNKWWPRPEAERLLSALEAAEIELYSRRPKDETPAAAWWLVAQENLKRARNYYEETKYQVCWSQIKAAERAMLWDPTDDAGVKSKAITLWREAEDLTSARRSKAMRDLLTDDADKTKPTPTPTLTTDRARIIEAMRVRDEYFDTQYFRIDLRRRHLLNLFWILTAALVCLVALTYWGKVELFNGSHPTIEWRDRLLVVVLLGIIGASLSVAQSIVSSDLYTKIALQQVGAFMAWMRPAIGATAAVIAYILLMANNSLQIFTTKLSEDFSVVAVFALLAGFSERFIAGALNRVAEAQSAASDKAKS